jgi:hypothetical protein
LTEHARSMAHSRARGLLQCKASGVDEASASAGISAGTGRALARLQVLQMPSDLRPNTRVVREVVACPTLGTALPQQGRWNIYELGQQLSRGCGGGRGLVTNVLGTRCMNRQASFVPCMHAVMMICRVVCCHNIGWEGLARAYFGVSCAIIVERGAKRQ